MTYFLGHMHFKWTPLLVATGTVYVKYLKYVCFYILSSLYVVLFFFSSMLLFFGLLAQDNIHW